MHVSSPPSLQFIFLRSFTKWEMTNTTFISIWFSLISKIILKKNNNDIANSCPHSTFLFESMPVQNYQALWNAQKGLAFIFLVMYWILESVQAYYKCNFNLSGILSVNFSWTMENLILSTFWQRFKCHYPNQWL